MENISENGSSLILDAQKSYYVIDALYLSNINEQISSLNLLDLDNEIRMKVFPFTDSPYMKFKPLRNVLSVIEIRQNNETIKEKKECFDVDSGMIMLIDDKIFIEIVTKFNFGDLVDSQTSLINMVFWKGLTKQFELNQIGIILSPGVDSGYEFVGSGEYKIVQEL
ncbi:hypothetical protein [Solitalea canadensis]|uniref:Uncharacterized protein n=1 Tax=Solitalea canadensis (strain ATCC 29591 / DSM 3403 / JCM 21819 / LMG 8368 / NBRC 15130 / NCIMB 12057 / USAM 9D) TaxID=929556 RepID=H8KV84_SOLCM|nr:hypothetical protein [Solitalea canadensis]AFD06142.1 hypothetical protein Solca_1034 [Solitalea canadensis DSM 3403]